ncbi:MAG: response regulator [Candidatus Moranbacteria bacterium]|nr:response regulator [Candidatus Moranbacteria bacterium]
MDNPEKKKILIVEDDRALQAALEETLEQEGFETVGAFDGEEGTQKAKDEKPDLILLDIILPKKNGYEVLADLKNGEEQDIPVMIMTNLEEIDNIQKALDLGAKTFMIKSDFSLKDIVEKIKEYFSKK